MPLDVTQWCISLNIFGLAHPVVVTYLIKKVLMAKKLHIPRLLACSCAVVVLCAVHAGKQSSDSGLQVHCCHVFCRTQQTFSVCVSQVDSVGDIYTVEPAAGSTATILVGDLAACKAYIHIIDTVLIPKAVRLAFLVEHKESK